ncbi:YdcF family protein [Duganella sp. SAP-35]|jgi:uncharacterized SAM-binding protein YcdF (DUF218 family)|uniref:YdcF family protein n=1 Tax=Duganella aceris TaxID=2703883 RepID=A0ABX0FN59_9BURK|nr:YdcF family protein [Duganella aceris]
MFRHLLVSGGQTANLSRSEADVIAEELVRLGIPDDILILESEATNTGENVRFGRAKVAEVIGLDEIRTIATIIQSQQ